MSKITKKEVQHIAKLARLKLSPKEVEKFTTQLSSILEYMEILNEVDTEKIEPTSQVTGLKDVLREDKVEGCDENFRQRLIGCFPESEGDLLQVKKVFE